MSPVVRSIRPFTQESSCNIFNHISCFLNFVVKTHGVINLKFCCINHVLTEKELLISMCFPMCDNLSTTDDKTPYCVSKHCTVCFPFRGLMRFSFLLHLWFAHLFAHFYFRLLEWNNVNALKNWFFHDNSL